MILDYLFLPILFLLLGYFSWQDFKYGKISNKWLKFGFCWAGVVLLGLAIWNLIAHPVSLFVYEKFLGIGGDQPRPVFTVSFVYLGEVLLNIVVSLLVAFLLWRFKAWKAGDAKLFSLVALMLPLKYYSGAFLFWFPSLALLINIFAVAIFWLLTGRVLGFFKNKREIKKIFSRELYMNFFKNNKDKLKNFPLSFLLILNIQMIAFLFFPEYKNGILLGSLALMAILWRLVQKNQKMLLFIYAFFAASFIFLVFIWQKTHLASQLFGLVGQLALFMGSIIFVFAFLGLLVDKNSEQRTHFALFIFLGAVLTILLKESVLFFLK